MQYVLSNSDVCTYTLLLPAAIVEELELVWVWCGNCIDLFWCGCWRKFCAHGQL